MIKLKFDRKVGWSELFSLLALAFSAFALWQVNVQIRQNLPDILVERRVPVTFVSADPAKSNEINVGLTFLVTNRGGRAVSLLKLTQAELPPFLRLWQKNVAEDSQIDAEYALLDGSFNSPQELATELGKAALKPMLMPQVLNEVVESGHTRSFALALRLRDKRHKPIDGQDAIAFTCILVFSDGSTYRLSQLIAQSPYLP